LNLLIQFFNEHQVLCSLAAGYIWSAFVSALPAPSAQSGPLYKFWFSFFNLLAANISRAQNTKVESSPNFAPAMNALNAQHGVKKAVVEMDSSKGAS
jgi:hypothetical protein